MDQQVPAGWSTSTARGYTGSCEQGSESCDSEMTPGELNLRASVWIVAAVAGVAVWAGVFTMLAGGVRL